MVGSGVWVGGTGVKVAVGVGVSVGVGVRVTVKVGVGVAGWKGVGVMDGVRVGSGVGVMVTGCSNNAGMAASTDPVCRKIKPTSRMVPASISADMINIPRLITFCFIRKKKPAYLGQVFMEIPHQCKCR